MDRIKTWTKGGVVGGAVFAILAGGIVFASANEWITFMSMDADTRTYEFKTFTDVSVAKERYEYRTVYWGTNYNTSSPQSVDGWHEVINCRSEGYVNKTVEDACYGAFVPALVTSTPGYVLWTKSTTNYAGCGSWTFSPNPSCGDIAYRSFFVSF